jgi:hypothetical protein
LPGCSKHALAGGVREDSWACSGRCRRRAANINIAAGLTLFLTALVGAVLFFFTLFSFNATVISAGFVLTGLAALALFARAYRHTTRLPPKRRGPIATALLAAAHTLLLATNVIVGVFAAPSIVGAILDPKISERVPVGGSTIFAAFVVSSVLSLAMLVEKGKRSG